MLCLLTSLLPIEAEIHKSQLTLFGNIIRRDCVERDLAIRQLAVKDLKSRSWFITIQDLLMTYLQIIQKNKHGNTK